MKNQGSELRLFAAALNYASKIAHGDPEYTLEKAEKIFPPKYFAMVAKEYSNLIELDRYAKTRRILLTKASWTYKYEMENLQVAERQLKHLRKLRDTWEDVVSKYEMSAKERALFETYSKAINAVIIGFSEGWSGLQKWFYNIGALENTASIKQEIERRTEATNMMIDSTVELQDAMKDILRKLLNNGDK